jgi:hypothetical protein
MAGRSTAVWLERDARGIAPNRASFHERRRFSQSGRVSLPKHQMAWQPSWPWRKRQRPLTVEGVPGKVDELSQGPA